ncbi:MAG: alpha/beta fold hydrolase [Gammaproteobacteria bacterium]|nr:MAG: alpha/beta fold hydrolase [Gammaproteobacteria bacterium]
MSVNHTTEPAARRPWLARAVLVAVLVSFGAGCTRLDTEVWHDVRLTEEFSVRKADQVRTFEDYLALEERLLAELDQKVYAVTATRPEKGLIRYSPGSAADPRAWQPNWNRSFELPATQPKGGVLLLHGMSDSPYSLRVVGEALNRAGYQVVGLRLPGNGAAPSGLKYVVWEDMAGAVRIAMNHLASELGDKPIHIVGYSIGSTLALNYTLDALDGRSAPVPASLILISPAIGVHPAAALAGLKRGLSVLPGLHGLAWLTIEPEFDPYKYNSFTTRAGEQAHRLTRSVGARIARRDRIGTLGDFPPTLVFKSNVDATVTNQAVVGRLLGRLDANRNELVLFDINRLAAKSILQVADPNALTTTVVGAPDLPFAVTLVTNEDDNSPAVEARHQPPNSATFSRAEPLGMSWPSTVISLSHVALPFSPDDPLYGVRPPDSPQTLFLGQIAIQGERGMFALPTDWLLRMRYNPFYDYLEKRVIEWADQNSEPSR